MYGQTGKLCALLFLAGLTMYDVEWKEIPSRWLWIFGSLAIIYFTTGEEFSAENAVFCLLPGMALFLLSLLTKEKIGYGDGLTVLILGFFLGGSLCIGIVLVGIMLSGVFALYRIIRKEREPIPFIPFLLAAMEVILFYA